MAKERQTLNLSVQIQIDERNGVYVKTDDAIYRIGRLVAQSKTKDTVVQGWAGVGRYGITDWMMSPENAANQLLGMTLIRSISAE